tara:strand:- start:597 stop:818 length:222 start_codon:yes stop_codon:yes gene_type:complete
LFIANENKNNENKAMSIEGNKVNKEKKAIYLRFVFDPRLLIFSLNSFFISIKMKPKKMSNKIKLSNKSNWRFI